jgi:hypothetical protein
LGLIFSLAVLALQVCVQVASYVPGNRISQIDAFLAWLATLVAFATMFAIDGNPLLRRSLTGGGKSGVSGSQTARQIAMWRDLPRWLKLTVKVAGTYVVITIILACVALSNGGPSRVVNASHWVGNRKLGIPDRLVTEAEYWRLMGHEVRFLSAVGMMISGMCVVAFIWDRRRPWRSAG